MHSGKERVVSVAVIMIMILASTTAVLVMGNSHSPEINLQRSANSSLNPNNLIRISPPVALPKVLGNISLGLDGVTVIALDTFNGYLYAVDSGQNVINVINPSNNSFVTNITTGGRGLSGIAFDNQNGKLYVAEDGSIAVINGNTNTVGTFLITNGNATHIIYDNVSGMLFASFSSSISGYGYVLEINPASIQIQYKLTGFNDPYGMATDTANGNVYVADQGLQGVDIINGTTGAFVKKIGLHSDAVNLAYDSTDNWMFLDNGYNVTVFNASTGTIVRNISVANGIYGIAYDNSTGNIFVGGGQQSYMYIMNPATGGTVKMIQTSTGSSYIFYDWQDNKVFTSNTQYELMIVDGTTNNVDGYMKVGEYPQAITYDSSTKDLYIAEVQDSVVQVVGSSTGKQKAMVSVGNDPYAIMAVPQVGKVFVADYGSNQVSVINDQTFRLEGNIGVGTSPFGMAMDKANGILYVMNSNSANISMINASSGKIQGSVYIGQMNGIVITPYQAVWDSANHNVYFTDSLGNSIFVLNTSSDSITKIATISNFANGITFDPENGEIYVISSNDVWTINTTTNSLMGRISLGVVPNAVLFDPFLGNIFCVNSYTNQVAVIDGSQNNLMGNITVGDFPRNIALNTNNGDAYVSNTDSNNLTVIGLDTFTTTFNETGYTSGSWYLNITGTLSVTSGPINVNNYGISLPNGQYHFAVGYNGKYNVTPESGNFTISDSPYSKTIVFKALIVVEPNNLLSIPDMALIFLVLVSIAAFVVYVRNKRN